MTSYRTLPDDTKGMPKGVPYIIGNELAERFSFYGMKAILTVYMTKHLMDSSGAAAHMSEEDAKAVYHLFTAAAYIFPLVGALLSDIFLGKYRTILVLSMGYCIGHALLAFGDSGAGAALMEPQTWLFAGLVFIAIGAGGIKPCVSAHVGDQFGSRNKHLISKIFSWFYFSINLGSFASTLLIPVLLETVGPWAAFGLPGVLMALATFVFWLGRNRFVHIPAGGMKFVRETFSRDGLRAMLNLAPIFLIFIPMFWALFDQTGSAWVLQAASMDREFLGVTLLQSQVQAANPLLICMLIPVFAYGIYPAIDRVWTMTPLRKIGIGMFVTALAFSISAVIEMAIGAGEGQAIANLVAAFPDIVNADMTLKAALASLDTAEIASELIAPSLDHMPNIGWQLLAYVVLTAAEVMVSITALEFAYTQAPKKMKSFIMGVFFAGVSIGNLFTAGVNYFMQNDAETIKRTGQAVKLVGADYYWFFTILMAIFAVGFVVFARFYRGQTYIQSADDVEGEAETEAIGNV